MRAHTAVWLSACHWRRWRSSMIASVLLCSQGALGWAEDDFQTWHTLEIAKRVGTTWEMFCLPEIRIRDDASELFYHEYRQGVRWKPSPHLQVGLHYLFVRNAASGKPREEHTGELDLTPKATVGPVQLSVRGRLALKAIQGNAGEQEWQLRVMPKAAYPTRVAGHPITPYVADDLFYDYTRDAWNQNRFFLGVTTPLGRVWGAELEGELYYMLQHQLGKRHDWSSNQILGTRLRVRF